MTRIMRVYPAGSIPVLSRPNHRAGFIYNFKMVDNVVISSSSNFACFFKHFCTVAAFSTASYLVYRYLKRAPKSSEKSERKEMISEVLFFPDKKIACKKFLNGTDCTRVNCPFAHKETSLSKLIKVISKAKRSLDVCVFTINCHELANAVIRLHRNGVVVRVLTDDEQMGSTGSQIQKFREEGIRVRHDLSSFFMHHKFVIIDDKALANGSFNWTRQAVTGNRENVVISHDFQLIGAFKNEFEKLWIEYDPAKRT